MEKKTIENHIMQPLKRGWRILAYQNFLIFNQLRKLSGLFLSF